MATKDPDLEEPPELGLEVTSFLRGSAENSEEEEKVPSPKPPVKELHKMCETPDWWRELLAVPGVQDCKELAWKVGALFHHPKRASEVNKVENYCPLHHCVSSERVSSHLPILSLAAKTFGRCRGEDRAYTHALQYRVEKTDLPIGGQPHLLAESVKELQEEMRCYLSFSDKEVFESVTPPEEMSTEPTEKAEPHNMATTPAGTPKVQATTKASQEPAMERKSPKFPRWEKVLHPFWPVVAAGQLPHPSGSPEQRSHSWQTMTTPRETPSPAQKLGVVWQVTLTPGFLGVMACLRSQSPEEIPKATPDPLAVGVMTAPGVATVCTSCIVRDEVTGATYVDMVTTSVGRVALSGPERETPAQGPIIEDMMDLIWRVARYPPLGGRMIPLPLLSRQNKCRLPMGGQACQRLPLGEGLLCHRVVPILNIPMLPQ